MDAVFRVVAFAFLMIAICGGAVSAATPDRGYAPIVPAAVMRRVPPHYPVKAIEREQEGWVDLTFTVTPEGTTSDIRVVGAYPWGVFDRAAVNAVEKWSYTPRMDRGVAIPQADNHAILSFALSESATIRPPLLPTFGAISARIREHDWEGASRIVNNLSVTPGLKLFELAVLEQMRGRIAVARQNYAAAADSFDRALSITARFDPTRRALLSEMFVMAAINAHQFDRAIQAFDVWNPPDSPRLRNLRRIVEIVRAAQASGRPFAPPSLPPSNLEP